MFYLFAVINLIIWLGCFFYFLYSFLKKNNLIMLSFFLISIVVLISDIAFSYSLIYNSSISEITFCTYQMVVFVAGVLLVESIYRVYLVEAGNLSICKNCPYRNI